MYYDYSRFVFESGLSGLLKANNLGRWYDVSDTLFRFRGNTHERVYLISTRDRDVSLVVFSCLDTRTDRVSDEIGTFVRIYKYTACMDGYLFEYVGKRKRVGGMFGRLEEYIVGLVRCIENS